MATELTSVAVDRPHAGDDARVTLPNANGNGAATPATNGHGEEDTKVMMTELRRNITPDKYDHELKAKAPICLSWDNVSYSVPVVIKKGKEKTKTTKTILTDVSGHVQPGEFLAILGASGAGKTTLLDVLSGRIDTKGSQVLAGNVLVNGEKLPHRVFKQYSAYVQQHDVLLPSMTVYESLNFSAQLRLPAAMSPHEKKQRVKAIIQTLGLEKCEHTLVGDANLRGISGGEKRRTSIGVELVTQPSLIFLDEPTSGLDSFTAFHVVDALRKLARHGHTIIATVHAPSSEIFSMFDRLMLLVNGRVIYHGPNSSSVQFFSNLGYPCPQYTNPADFFLRIMNDDLIHSASSVSVFCEAAAKFYADDRKPLALAQTAQHANGTEALPERHLTLTRTSSGMTPSDERVSLLYELRLLSKRAFVNYLRQPLLFKVRTGQTIIMSLFAGLLFLQIGHNQASVQDRTGLLFFTTMMNFMGSLLSVALTFPAERLLFTREIDNNMYSPITYFLSKLISEFPFQLYAPILFSSIVYWMSGLQTGFDQYAAFTFTCVLLVLVAQSVGQTLSAAVPNAESAVSLAPVCILPFVLFAGFFLNKDNIPKYFIWLEVISPFKYAFEALVITEFSGLALHCDAKEYVQGICPLPNGEAQMRRLAVDPDNRGFDWWILFALFVGFRILAFVVLKLRVRK